MNWNKLRGLLDAMFGFTNRTRSTVKTLQQGFDNRTQEHVVWLEYRAHVSTAAAASPQLKNNQLGKNAKMALMRELLSSAKSPE
jgi:hypothetical protein